MKIRGFFRDTTGMTGWRTWLCVIVVLVSVILFTQPSFAAQQTPPNKQTAHPPTKPPSPFADAQELLQQGKFEDAKIRIQEELQQNPSNAQGYALLGLVYTAQKNYPEALAAFQQGLNLNPTST